MLKIADDVRERVLERVGNGEASSKLAKEIGVSPATVYNWVRDKQAKNEGVMVHSSLTVDEQIDHLVQDFKKKMKALLTAQMTQTLTQTLRSLGNGQA